VESSAISLNLPVSGTLKPICTGTLGDLSVAGIERVF